MIKDILLFLWWLGKKIVKLIEEWDEEPFESIENEQMKKIQEAKKIIGKIDGKDLDKQQLACIVKEGNRQLVVAGAGTGKTTTIIGKIKYLIKTEACKPDEILAISYTRKSAEDMYQQIRKGLEGCRDIEKIKVATFHSLGLGIMGEVLNGKPTPYNDQDKAEFIKSLFEETSDNQDVHKLVEDYFIYENNNYMDFDEFERVDDYIEFLNHNPYTTLKGEKVKSYGELYIANFLFRNGIEYEYERDYEIITRTRERIQYRPDFYLPEYGVYIEYFGINRDGDVRADFISLSGKSSKEEYNESMQWKLELHKRKGTKLIDCYFYEFTEGNLLSILDRNLKAAGVVFNPINSKTLLEIVNINIGSRLNLVSKEISGLISMIKEQGMSSETFRKLCIRRNIYFRNKNFIELVCYTYDKYLRRLKEDNRMDFSDMIIESSKALNEGKYLNPYKYIIVDEYQDISRIRFLLLLALVKNSSSWLFCVGDDWQSIYHFAGSDVNYTLDFKKFGRNAKVSKIETTYRFRPLVLKISSWFIQRNPRQIKKNLRCASKQFENADSFEIIHCNSERTGVVYVKQRLDYMPENSSVLFLGRYNSDFEILFSDIEFRKKERSKVLYTARTDLNISYMTIHSSKGLQADFVFVLNNKDPKYEKGKGFPSAIKNSCIANLLNPQTEKYQFAEERRLFYVAITRSKVKTYLVALNGKESSFVKEIERQFGDILRASKKHCPLCGGNLFLSKDNSVYTCENLDCGFVRKNYFYRGE